MHAVGAEVPPCWYTPLLRDTLLEAMQEPVMARPDMCCIKSNTNLLANPVPAAAAGTQHTAAQHTDTRLDKDLTLCMPGTSPGHVPCPPAVWVLAHHALCVL
jgi:hypothetical protein